MARKITFFDAQLTAPRWMGEVGDPNTLLPASSLVNDLKFTADTTTGRKTIRGGTLLGRRSGAYLWEPVANAKTTNLETPIAANAAAAATILKLPHVSGFAVGDGITIAQGATTETKTITALNQEEGLITVGVGLTNSFTVAAGATVRLTAAVDQTEFYLLGYDIDDAAIRADVPALYRHGSVVRFNFLPQYPFTNLANVAALIRQLYECVEAI